MHVDAPGCDEGVYQKHLPELKALMKEGVGKKEGIPEIRSSMNKNY